MSDSNKAKHMEYIYNNIGRLTDQQNKTCMYFMIISSFVLFFIYTDHQESLIQYKMTTLVVLGLLSLQFMIFDAFQLREELCYRQKLEEVIQSFEKDINFSLNIDHIRKNISLVKTFFSPSVFAKYSLVYTYICAVVIIFFG